MATPHPQTESSQSYPYPQAQKRIPTAPVPSSRQTQSPAGRGALGWAPEPISKLGSDPITLLAAAKQASQRQQGSIAPESPLTSHHPVHSTFSHGPSPRIPASPTRRGIVAAGLNSTFSSLPNIAPDAFAPLQTSRTSCLSLGDMRQELLTVLSVPRRQAMTVFSHAARTASLRSHPGPHRGEPKVLIRGRPVDPVVAEGIRARTQAVVDAQAQAGLHGVQVTQQDRNEVSAVQQAVREDLRHQKRHEGQQERGRPPSPSSVPRHAAPASPKTPLQSPSKGVRGSPKLHHSGIFNPSPDKVILPMPNAASVPSRLPTRFSPESAFNMVAFSPTATHIPPIASQSRPQTVAQPAPQTPNHNSHHRLRTAGREAATMTLDDQEASSHQHPKVPSRMEPSLSVSVPAPPAAHTSFLGVTCAPPPVYTYPIKMTISELGIPIGRIGRDLHKLSQYDPVPEPPAPSFASPAAEATGKPLVAVAAGDGGASPRCLTTSPKQSRTEPAATPTGQTGPPTLQRAPSKSILRPSRPSLHDINMQGDYRWRAQALTAKTTANTATVKRIKSAKSVRFLVVEGHHTDLSA